MVDNTLIKKLLRKHFEITGTVSFNHLNQITVSGDVALKEMGGIPPEIRFFHVSGNFWCSSNQELHSLWGMPGTVGGHFVCNYNRQLKSLAGAPKSVGKDFRCHSCPLLESLDGLPGEIGGELQVTYSKNLNLLCALVAKGGVKVFGSALPEDPDYSSIWDRLKLLEKILNSYKGQGKRALFDCQKDLEDAGFEENARW